MNKPTNIDDYIAGFPIDIQHLLQQVRRTVHQVVPEAREVISYSMPAFKYKGTLAHFAAYKKHIGLYPGASCIEAFKEELSGYTGGKGSVQFPYDQPLPLALIADIVAFKLAENERRAVARKK